MIAYFTFGMCFIAGAACVICGQAIFEWKHSEQKAHEEYWKLKSYLAKLDISKDSQQHVISEIKSIKELIKANHRLERVTREM